MGAYCPLGDVYGGRVLDRASPRGFPLDGLSSVSPSSGLFGRSALPGITGGLAGDVLPAASLGPVVGS